MTVKVLEKLGYNARYDIYEFKVELEDGTTDIVSLEQISNAALLWNIKPGDSLTLEVDQESVNTYVVV